MLNSFNTFRIWRAGGHSFVPRLFPFDRLAPSHVEPNTTDAHYKDQPGLPVYHSRGGPRLH